MFRLKRQQKTILDHDIYLSADRQAALEKSWAGPFRRSVLPMIKEEPFRPGYCPDNRRPNVPVAIFANGVKSSLNYPISYFITHDDYDPFVARVISSTTLLFLCLHM
ncbi:MAG: hypothetical protein ACLFUU_01455 [Desulfobacteraceae bacterium]